MSDRDDEWVTIRVAARILETHPSNVPKLTRRGQLHPRPERPSLRKAEVVALREARDEAARLRALPKPPKEPPPEPQPPDDEHDWVLAHVVAAHLGVGVAAVHQRARRGRLPFTLGATGHRFYRLDLVDMAVRAQLASRARTLEPPPADVSDGQ